MRPGGLIPSAHDPLEDWTWSTASDAEIKARQATLALRATDSSKADLDADGVLRFGSAWTTLPPVEARLCRALVDRFGSVVSREEVTSAGWPDGAPGRNALDVHMLRLRRRVQAVGLTVRTVRSRGYLIDKLPGGPRLASAESQIPVDEG